MTIYKNNCREEVLSRIQLAKDHTEYTIGKTLFAASDKGKVRGYQEDSVIIMEHPHDNNIKLIAVADGVGGYGDGDIMSNHIIKKTIEWFENREFNENDSPTNVYREIKDMLHESRYDVLSPYAATTLSLAIVEKDKTLIINIGDSRIYTYQNGKLKQETTDDAAVQSLYEEKVIPSKELMRFHHKSNIIEQAITKRMPKFYPNFKIIDNDYDYIIAVSDGVSDCLSREDLENIIKNSKGENIANDIVDGALNHDSYLIDIIRNLPSNEKEKVFQIKEIINADYYKDISGGKDNTTAAVYKPKK